MIGHTLVIALLSTLASAAPFHPRQDSNAGVDPCAALVGVEGYYTPSAIKACLTSIPFREDVRQNILASVTALNTLNIFEYNQLGNDNPVVNQGVDLDREFKRINSTEYTSDYEFQKDLSDTLRSLNDGHYAWTSCYATAFSASHFFPIVALEDGNETSVFLAPNLPLYAAQSNLTAVFSSLGYDLPRLAGAKVTAIGGQTPWEYLDKVAGVASGTYQDSEQRMNYQFASYTTLVGGFSLQPGQFALARNFDADNITITVQTGDEGEREILSPWSGSYMGTQPWAFTSGEAFFEARCILATSAAVSNATTNAAEPDPAAASQDTNTTAPAASSITEIIPQTYAQCPVDVTAARYRYSNSPQAGSEYLGGRDIQFYALGDDKNTGVIFLSTFYPKLPLSQDPEGRSSACTYRFIIDTFLGFQNFTRAGVERVMIDTSGNGGGSVALNQYLQRFMTGDDFEVDLNFDTLLRKSSLAEALLAANVKAGLSSATSQNTYQPGLYRNGTAIVRADEGIFSPGNEYTINGQSLVTSDIIQDDVQLIDTLESILRISDTPPYSPNEIVFIGNGLCGSACASFTNFLIEYYNATAYITSGRPGNPIEFQAFAAGQATTSDVIYKEAATVNFSDANLLPALNVVGSFGFTIRGAISPNIAPGTFVQYRSYPAQNRYALTAEQFLNPLENWKFVAGKAFA